MSLDWRDKLQLGLITTYIGILLILTMFYIKDERSRRKRDRLCPFYMLRSLILITSILYSAWYCLYYTPCGRNLCRLVAITEIIMYVFLRCIMLIFLALRYHLLADKDISKTIRNVVLVIVIVSFIFGVMEVIGLVPIAENGSCNYALGIVGSIFFPLFIASTTLSSGILIQRYIFELKAFQSLSVSLLKGETGRQQDVRIEKIIRISKISSYIGLSLCVVTDLTYFCVYATRLADSEGFVRLVDFLYTFNIFANNFCILLTYKAFWTMFPCTKEQNDGFK